MGGRRRGRRRAAATARADGGVALPGAGPAGFSPCAPIVLSQRGSTASQGTWTRDALISEIPALDGAGLAALMALLGALAVAALRR